MKNPFVGKTVVITGGANGIGFELAKGFAASDANVWVLDHSQKSLDALNKSAPNIFCLNADVTKIEELEACAEKVYTAHNSIDYWINNAGIVDLGPFHESNLEKFNQVINVNLLGVTNGSRVAVKYMMPQKRGHIINIASMAGILTPVFMSSYATSKAAVVSFSRALREEMKILDSNIKVTMVAPGFVNTAILSREAEFGFPSLFDSLVASAHATAKEIIKGIKSGREELFPTWNAKAMRVIEKLPPITGKLSRALYKREYQAQLEGRN